MNSMIASRNWSALSCGAALLITLCPVVFGQSNILCNGSFEDTNSPCWSGGMGIDQIFVYQGSNSAVIQNTIWQDVGTVPGRAYIVRFASTDSIGSTRARCGAILSSLISPSFRTICFACGTGIRAVPPP